MQSKVQIIFTWHGFVCVHMGFLKSHKNTHQALLILQKVILYQKHLSK